MKDEAHTNTRLVEKCLEGDVKAQYQLYRKYSKGLYNIAIRLMGNKMDAEDVLQESFIKAFRCMGELKDTEALGGWLKRIVTNKCISLLRKTRVRFEEIEDYKLDVTEEEELESYIEPELVHNTIKELPEGARTIIVLRALEGYAHKEIAEMLGISLSTSKTQYHRALGILKMKLKQQLYAE
ncbi:RNA polymerase sigma factor [Bacteroidota bacterium]